MVGANSENEKNESKLDENIFFKYFSIRKSHKEKGNKDIDVLHSRKARKRSGREDNLSRN